MLIKKYKNHISTLKKTSTVLKTLMHVSVLM